MNIQQFQYVLAVADSKNFEMAAEKCFVTQSTLSTMINRFEKEIDIKIFNRKTKPLSITNEGHQLIERLRIITNEIDMLDNVIQEIKGEMTGDLHIGIIPTIAPYLLPIIINEYAARFPKVNMHIREMTTGQIQQQLLLRNLDIGILAIPLLNKELTEIPVYKEPFVIYDCTETSHQGKLTPSDLDYSKICLLEEGHCLRTQVHEICQLSEAHLDSNWNYKFESGSMESLLRITRSCKGLTILPYLAYHFLSEEHRAQVSYFKNPVPAREVGIVTHHFFAKKTLMKSLVEVVRETVSDLLPADDDSLVIAPV